MSVAGPLDRLPLWLFLGTTIVLLLLSIEAGYRLGRYRQHHATHENEGHVATLATGTMGLLAFVLAFNFGLAANRFESRKQLVVDEANAIGTTFLRAGLLPGDHGAKVRELLREYVRLRLEVPASLDRIEHVLSRSEELHRELWREAESAGRDYPESTSVGLFIESLNQTIDLHATRVKVAIRGHIPGVLWVALFLVSTLTLMAVGYHGGLVRTSRSPVIAILVVNFSIILMLIADLDRPQEGALMVSQQAMIDLQHRMED